MRILALLCLLINLSSYSQTLDLEFGSVSIEEMEMKSYEKDVEAPAVILYDKGKSVFYEKFHDYNIRFTRHKRIKIFDKTKAEYSEISIPFYSDGYGKTEEISSLEVATYYLENGRIFRKNLDPSAIYVERINEKWSHMKFTFPNVQDGVVLEYKYVLETPFQFHLPDWTFQDRIPTIYSEYQANMIPFYEYVFYAQGISMFDYQKIELSERKRTWGSASYVKGQKVGNGVEFQDNVFTYVLKDIPAFKDEAYISSVNDYIIKMDFQLAKIHRPSGTTKEIISSWPALNKALIEHDNFGRYLKSSSKIAKKIISDELSLDELNKNEKAKIIINYIKSSFEWNGQHGKYASQSPKDFFAKKTGNSADINLFLIALLNEAEVETQPLILSTRQHGKIQSEYPFDHLTNYVIALVHSDSPFLADGTEIFLPYNRVPNKCNNEKGLVVEKNDNPNWISLDNNIPSLEQTTIHMTLDSISRDLNTNVTVIRTQYDSFNARKKFKNDTVKIKTFYQDKIGEITTTQTNGIESKTKPYYLSLKSNFETEKLGHTTLILPFLNLPLAENKLTQESRSYPVDFIYPWEKQFESRIQIPNNFSLAELPEGFEIENDMVSISLKYIFSDNTLLTKGKYKFKKSIYEADDYTAIKNYIEKIVVSFNAPVILEKTN